jgi:hypothetical protein
MNSKVPGFIAGAFGLILILISLVQSANAGSYANQAHRGNLCPDSHGNMRPCPWTNWGGGGSRGSGGGSYRYVQPRTYYVPPRVIHVPPRLLGYRVCGPGGCFFVPN